MAAATAAASAAELLLSRHVFPLVNGAAVYVDDGASALLLALDGGLARLMACGADSVHELPPSPIVPLRAHARSAVALVSCAEQVHSDALREIAARHDELRVIVSFAGPRLLSPLVPLLSDVLYVPARPPHVPMRSNASDCMAMLHGLRAIIDHSAQLSLWALGDTAKQCATAFSQIPSAREPGLPLIGNGSDVAVVFLDRNLDLDPLVAPSAQLSILEQLIRGSAGPATAPLSALFDGASNEVSDQESQVQIPYSLNTSPVLREWLELLVDYPDDGPSLLRRKILALGVKARILGKPTTAQFHQLASLLRATPGLVCGDILLFLGAFAEFVEDSPHSPWLRTAASLEPYDVSGTISAIESAPSRDMAQRLSVWALLQAWIRGSRESALHECIFNTLGIPESVIDGFLASLPSEPMPNMMHVGLLSLQHNPDIFTRIKGEEKSTMFGLGLGRYLGGGSTSPTNVRAPIDCREVIVCVTGPVSWKEINTFRSVARGLPASGHECKLTLVANGIGGGVSFF